MSPAGEEPGGLKSRNCPDVLNSLAVGPTTDPAELATLGFHKADAWRPLLEGAVQTARAAAHAINVVQFRGKPFPGAKDPKSIADFS